MAAILNAWRHISSPASSIDAFYLKNIPAKFHPDPIWNDRVLKLGGLLNTAVPNKNNYKMISDMRSVPDPKLLLSIPKLF